MNNKINATKEETKQFLEAWVAVNAHSNKINWKQVLTPYDISALFTDGQGHSLDTHKTSADVYISKTMNIDPPKERKYIDREKRYRPALLQFAEERLQCQVYIDNKKDAIYKEDPLFVTTIDAWANPPEYDSDVVIRTHVADNAVEWGVDGTSEIPSRYYIRLQCDLLCTGWKWACLAVLLPDHKEYLYVIERDDEMIEKILRSGRTFWDKCVVKGVAPKEVEVGDIEILKRIRRIPDKFAELTEEQTEVVSMMQKQLDKANTLRKYWEKEEESLKASILFLMGDAELLKTDVGLCKYTLVNKTGVDSNKLKGSYPQVYQECLKDSSYRKYDFKPEDKDAFEQLHDTYITAVGGTIKERKGKK